MKSMTSAFTVFAAKTTREKRIPFDVTIDSFYTPSNISYLEKVTSEIDSGTAKLTQHNLVETYDESSEKL